MKNQDQLVRDEMRRLIRKSCAYLHEKDNGPFYGFQKSLLKFFFSAADVTINFDHGIIQLWTSEYPKTPGHKLYSVKDAVTVSISYSDLEETLKGCLEDGANQTRFYRTMLFYYNHVSDSAAHQCISA